MSIFQMDEYLQIIVVWSGFRAHTRKIEEIKEMEEIKEIDEIEEKDRRKLLTLLVQFHFQWQKKLKKASWERESFLRAYLIERESEPARAQERQNVMENYFETWTQGF